MRTSCTAAFAVIGIASLAGGCARSSGPAEGGALIVGGPEIPSTITLTPQTVVVRDGARAVKRISDDGATVTLDPSSPGVAEVAPGSIVLIRGVEVVKATAVRRDGGDVVITAGPAALTELIQNGDIRWSSVKMNFTKGAIHTLPDTPPSAGPASWRRSNRLPALAFALPLGTPPDDGGRFTGKVKDFDYDAGYAVTGDRMTADGHVHGETHGVKVDINIKGCQG